MPTSQGNTGASGGHDQENVADAVGRAASVAPPGCGPLIGAVVSPTEFAATGVGVAATTLASTVLCETTGCTRVDTELCANRTVANGHAAINPRATQPAVPRVRASAQQHFSGKRALRWGDLPDRMDQSPACGFDQARLSGMRWFMTPSS